MRNATILTILGAICVRCSILIAQTWCPPGAQWYYEHWGVFGNQLGSVHVQYTEDTLVQGVLAKQLSCTVSGYDFLVGQPYQFIWPSHITKNDQAQVSRWNGNAWVLLFDLAVPIGGQWTLTGENFTDRTVTVLTTGLVSVQGTPLAYSTVSFDPPFSGIATDSIIERIGYRRLYLDPSRTVALDGDVFGVRCYNDDEIAYSTIGDLSCDLILSTTETTVHSPLILYPNPGIGLIRVKGLPATTKGIVVVQDAFGKVVAQRRMTEEGLLDLSFLSTGAYHCRVMGPNGEFFGAAHYIKW